MIVFLLLLLAQQDQIPRPPTKDARGLLKIDPLYFDLAANSGGDIYFWAPGEFATARLQVPIEREPVVLAYGAMESEKTFEIPVELGVKELTVFLAIQRKDLAVLLRPDATIERDVQTFQHMLIAIVKSPAKGLWRLELHGAGTYAFTAHVKPAEDGPELITFRFIEPGGRPGHEGMFPVKRPVRGGESLACELSLSGSAKDVKLAFVARDGSPLGAASITPVSGDEYAGDCSVPKVPFRAVVRGVDAKGASFQRIESHVHAPEP
ncbi:MAG TPA: hypothetical protein VER58_21720 [Thermoanaerobaculia bacterium]|nr:hypothetical protein [Thermoanaerobaculia bacterium]